jgi:type IV fimbrial biogenesis protein FimT
MFIGGYSCLELCTALVLVSILIFLGVPSFQQSLMRQERELVLERLQMAIEYARQEALIQGKTITLCGSPDQRSCHVDHWSNSFIVFENPDHSNIPKPGNILKVFSGTRYGKLYFAQFGQHLNIKANGMTINNGSFYYCPSKANHLEMDSLVINKSGRTYRPIKHPVLGIPLKNPETPLVTPFLCR